MKIAPIKYTQTHLDDTDLPLNDRNDEEVNFEQSDLISNNNNIQSDVNITHLNTDFKDKYLDNDIKIPYTKLWNGCFVIWAMFAFCMVAFFTWVILNNLPQATTPIPLPNYSEYSNVIEIALLGDSLINKPYVMYNLEYQIRSRLNLGSGYNTTVKLTNAGKDGQNIYRIRLRLESVLESRPAGLILYWDSDMDFLDETKLSSEKVQEIRQNFANNVKYVIERCRAVGTDVITIMGPGTYSEGPAFVPLYKRKKSLLLDTYRDINKNICANYSIPFSDIRSKILDTIPWYWPSPRWYVTMDGEHPNKRGTVLVAEFFAQHINDWLISKHITG